MNIKAIFTRRMIDGKRLTLSTRSPVLLVPLAAVSLAVIFASLRAMTSPAATRGINEKIGGGNPYATNPELRIANRYRTERSASSESEMLADNPELSITRRYAMARAADDEQASSSVDHELQPTDCDPTRQSSESQILAANPELSVARRFGAARTAEDESK